MKKFKLNLKIQILLAAICFIFFSCKRKLESSVDSQQVLATKWKHSSHKFILCWVQSSNFSKQETTLRLVVEKIVMKEMEATPLLVKFLKDECPETGVYTRIYSLTKDPVTGQKPNFAGLAHVGTPSFSDRNFHQDSRGYFKGIMLNADRFSKCGTNNPNCLGVALLHEFGHNLGFNHELSHSEAVGCQDFQAESKDKTNRGEFLSADFGSYDENSIMNYCAAASSAVPSGKFTRLTQGDVSAIWYLFGNFWQTGFTRSKRQVQVEVYESGATYRKCDLTPEVQLKVSYGGTFPRNQKVLFELQQPLKLQGANCNLVAGQQLRLNPIDFTFSELRETVSSTGSVDVREVEKNTRTQPEIQSCAGQKLVLAKGIEQHYVRRSPLPLNEILNSDELCSLELGTSVELCSTEKVNFKSQDNNGFVSFVLGGSVAACPTFSVGDRIYFDFGKLQAN